MSDVVWLDCETTGLDPSRHVPWEIGLIVDDHEYLWQLDLTDSEMSQADPMALKIGKFYERPRSPTIVGVDSRQWFANRLVTTIGRRHIVGAVPTFDDRFVGDFCRRQARPPIWHHHLIDIEALMVGYLAALVRQHPDDVSTRERIQPPWKSDELSRAIGINPSDFDRHTALGDARWAKAIYEQVM